MVPKSSRDYSLPPCLAKNARKVVCSAPEEATSLADGMKVKYIFDSRDGIEVGRASFVAADCVGYVLER